MGKKDSSNTPINSSLSYTLENLFSGVELQAIESSKDIWEPLEEEGWLSLSMSVKEQERFLSFFKKLKKHFGLKGCFKVRSANNFPKSSGAASSASSFSALTLATYQEALIRNRNKKKYSVKELSGISKKGSGSSCRSFFSPWCLWGKTIQSVSFDGFNNLDHDLILLSSEEKKVPSSTAHERVKTSPHFEGRSQRAENRLKNFLHCMETKDWKKLYKISYEEFEDMHLMFETSKPAFSYRSSKTFQTLDLLNHIWFKEEDGPLITMDAGPHIHLLYRPDQKKIKQKIKHKLLNFGS